MFTMIINKANYVLIINMICTIYIIMMYYWFNFIGPLQIEKYFTEINFLNTIYAHSIFSYDKNTKLDTLYRNYMYRYN